MMIVNDAAVKELLEKVKPATLLLQQNILMKNKSKD